MPEYDVPAFSLSIMVGPHPDNEEAIVVCAVSDPLGGSIIEALDAFDDGFDDGFA